MADSKDMTPIGELTASAAPLDGLKEDLKRRGFMGLAAILDSPIEEPPKPERCERCGGVKDEEHPAFDRGGCRCGGRKRRLLSLLDAVDPDRDMTLGTLELDEPTMQEAARISWDIVKHGRKRGIFLMGKPGLGKTHLIIAAGREMLRRDRDAGYYNMARLVSRIQDSYSDYEGETRRAIIESVASHDVVLLDDFGKEHQSSNVESIVYELIDALYAAGRTLVLSTNVPATREKGYAGPILGERYDEAVRSRIKAMCERVVVKGEDRRALGWEW